MQDPGPSKPRALRVLVADDGEVHRLVVRTLLTRRGHEVVEARDGDEALAVLAPGSFDLVLMDVEMPRLGGIEATRRLREREAPGPHMPVLALSGHLLDEVRERCIAAGMNGYVTKPVEEAGLFDAIDRVLSVASGAGQPPVRPWHDPHIAELFLETGRREIARIRAALEAGDTGEAGRIAHGLAGASGFSGAREVGDWARRLVDSAGAGDRKRADAACEELGRAIERFAAR